MEMVMTSSIFQFDLIYLEYIFMRSWEVTTSRIPSLALNTYLCVNRHMYLVLVNIID